MYNKPLTKNSNNYFVLVLSDLKIPIFDTKFPFFEVDVTTKFHDWAIF